MYSSSVKLKKGDILLVLSKLVENSVNRIFSFKWSMCEERDKALANWKVKVGTVKVIYEQKLKSGSAEMIFKNKCWGNMKLKCFTDG